MNDPVDQLKAALGVETDIALARELGLERSTIAQWRRRGALPALYRGIIDAGERAASLAVALAARQQVYGDSRAMYLLRGALAVIPAGLLDFPELSAHLLGDHRERLLLNVARVVQEVTAETLGKARCDNEDEYDQVIAALQSASAEPRIRRALAGATLGEHL